jgi:methyl-accepting chemotaxis protein
VAQRTAPPPPVLQAPQNTDETAWEAQQRREMVKKVNLRRQEEIKKDTEKLLELATELKQSVDKTDENTLSLDVIKKADQIEKLAKSVKDKMKGP